MSLELLKIYNARNLKEYTLRPHPSLNIIYGSNGVGKTTLLESIYLLLRSRTFRSSKYKNFIHYDSNECTVFSKFESNNSENFGGNFTLGITRSKDNLNPILHLNSKKINSLPSITRLVVLGLITPDSFTLLDSGPSIRRKFIDWGVFHVEHNFLTDWRAYKKLLSTRNILLKNLSKRFYSLKELPLHDLESLECWNPQLCKYNEIINVYRTKQIENISTIFKELLAKFSTELSKSLSLEFYQGWTKDLSYNDYLSIKLNDDLQAGYTRYGTHRSELKIKIAKTMAKEILSRGQKKIVIICLILAQYKYLTFSESNCFHHLLLLDDIDSELDKSNLKILFQILENFSCQVFITSTDINKFNFIKHENYKMFHVEHHLS